MVLSMTASIRLSCPTKMGRPVQESQQSAMTPSSFWYVPYLELGVFGNERSNVRQVAGEPLDQTVFQYGPFVMTSREEIQQTLIDCKYLAGPPRFWILLTHPTRSNWQEWFRKGPYMAKQDRTLNDFPGIMTVHLWLFIIVIVWSIALYYETKYFFFF